jgi:AraC-like DNA-binding protein
MRKAISRPTARTAARLGARSARRPMTTKPGRKSAGGAPPVGFGDVRVGPLLMIPALLAERGFDAADALRKVGLDPRLLDNSENRVSFDALGRLIETCIELTGCSHFGLLIGEQFEIESLGMLGDLMLHSPTVRDALRLATQHLEIHDRGSVALALDLGNSRAALGYALFSGRVPAAEQILDGAIAMQVRLLRRMCGPSFRPLVVQLSHSRPRRIEPLRRCLGANLEFDAKLSSIVFDSQWLDHRIAGADPAKYAALIRAIESSKPHEAGSFVWQVRRAIYALTLSATPAEENVASVFNLQERTLRRRLREGGATLRGLVSDVRRELAQHLLLDTDLTVTKVAEILSYSDPTVFARAFRRWTKKNPRDWRARET